MLQTAKRIDPRELIATGATIAAVAAIPAVGLSAVTIGQTPRERFEHHLREVERALGDLHPGSKVTTLGDGRGAETINPHVMIFAKAGWS